MTKIIFFKRGGVYFGFKETGHSEYADKGFDIVCSAMSAMTMLVINTIELSYSSNVDYKIDEESTDIEVRVNSALAEFEPDEKKRYAISGLIGGYFLQLMDMTEEYYDFLSVGEIEC